jgi:hypothetical protein
LIKRKVRHYRKTLGLSDKWRTPLRVLALLILFGINLVHLAALGAGKGQSLNAAVFLQPNTR